MSDRRRSSFGEAFAEYNATGSDEALDDVVDHPDCTLSSNISRCSAICAHFEDCGSVPRYVEAVMFKLMAMEAGR